MHFLELIQDLQEILHYEGYRNQKGRNFTT